MSDKTKTLYYVIKRGKEYCAPYQTKNWMMGNVFGTNKKLAVRFADSETARYYLNMAKMNAWSGSEDYNGTKVVRVFKRAKAKKSR